MIQDTLYEAFEIDWGDGNFEIGPAFSLISHDYGIIDTFSVTVKGLINGECWMVQDGLLVKWMELKYSRQMELW